ncbi:MAG: hypothetical protein BWY61_01341 [Firmicutes bacterium ADurb.Bin354]|nr:MAG: hypothetical protein BWY61_01341 [Firmicutes bacterium ADurb.Bin354]
MFNMHSNKGRKLIKTVMIVLLILAMVVPSIAVAFSLS